MSKEAEIINLDLPAGVEYIKMVRLLTSLVAKSIGFSEDVEEDINIAVSEACINTARHAYKNTCDVASCSFTKRMHIRYLRYSKKLVVVVKDFGRGFDPCFVQQYVKRKDAEAPEKIGLGIFLIKTLMDEVEYDSSLTCGTQVRMTKYQSK